MIKRPTVFVLGAGSSCPYQFPSGRELIFRIASGVKSRRTGLVARGETTWIGFDIDQISRFAKELVVSELPSADLFLENRPEYESIGKALIAAELIPCESPRRLRRNREKRE
jgi:hypothetical protein